MEWPGAVGTFSHLSKAVHIAVVGGGPAGLRAAELCAEGGATVDLFEAKRSVGRKLLVAGYGGLNLTHGEPVETFATRYSGPDLDPRSFRSWLDTFSPRKLRNWAAELGIETFEQRTGRVYPKEMKAAPLLRRLVERLRQQGVRFHVNQRLTAIENGDGVQLRFNDGEPRSFDAAILAMGGASWPKTGSDGSWIPALKAHRVSVNTFEPANCGWEANWPDSLVPTIEGQPLKNIAAKAGDTTVRGELMLTRYGFEGGAIYQLGPQLRAAGHPELVIDLKPEVPAEVIRRKMESVRRDFLDAAAGRLKLTEATRALIAHIAGPIISIEALVDAVKTLRVPLNGPRPIEEAISSAGGVAWSEIDDQLMLRKLPGVFVAGEMIDWEAPTGGYLIQGCFATATRAAQAALAFSADH
ncbi:NAD(FAD)-utilizing dehydrogenase [Haloferula helveola]|uniref:NAD(FAD)-utilizing dehydrogenase n=1 Tax=Haloferula helveola TaxID=490095 RepID=A0ABM7REZ1_9BACT|nr:NAD(FAD)-utilizing dehydrogenase [Haloferula helveola]